MFSNIPVVVCPVTMVTLWICLILRGNFRSGLLHHPPLIFPPTNHNVYVICLTCNLYPPQRSRTRITSGGQWMPLWSSARDIVPWFTNGIPIRTIGLSARYWANGGTLWDLKRNRNIMTWPTGWETERIRDTVCTPRSVGCCQGVYLANFNETCTQCSVCLSAQNGCATLWATAP